jgi:predicted RNA-binding Zn-ribbon protein involved in translation (DUF1610 family)
MSLINFDCPECGHNLEVDERGAGFIIKCPECGNPLQIPELPKSRRYRRYVPAIGSLVAVLLLFAANTYFWRQTQALRAQLYEQEEFLDDFRQHAQLAAMQQDAEIEQLKAAVEEARNESSQSLAQAALDAIETAEFLSIELEKTSRRFLDNHAGARTALLREHMGKVVEEAKNGLPAAPVITDVGPGRGIQGRQIVFPVLPGPDRQILRTDAEITAIDEDKVSVRFPGGSATYALTELHPGVAAYLPVDRLLVLPRRQWQAEVLRVHQLQNARRNEQIAELRNAIEARLPAE